ncbi:hypothetical protein Afil01_66100 [Actinorhabdospora filicis]|uniref:DUF3558 domain-containing protein n=1 Tax=Actinorhabdospora filicis TaxID=1785913 RepID=A0A9W6WD69_9ACTN|nr:hypothetical protein Afil01_66100 [Actinorhabdospora filicis]
MWLARERPRSANPVHRGLTRAILWLLPLCAVALLVIRAYAVPEAPDDLDPAYPDVCAELTPLAAKVLAASTLDDRTLDRDSTRCEWRAGESLLRVEAQRPLYVSSGETALGEAAEDYRDKVDGARGTTGVTPVPLVGVGVGVGDEAVWAAGEDRSVLVARVGPHVLELTVSMADPPQNQAQTAMLIAMALLERLPAE